MPRKLTKPTKRPQDDNIEAIHCPGCSRFISAECYSSIKKPLRSHALVNWDHDAKYYHHAHNQRNHSVKACMKKNRPDEVSKYVWSEYLRDYYTTDLWGSSIPGEKEVKELLRKMTADPLPGNEDVRSLIRKITGAA